MQNLKLKAWLVNTRRTSVLQFVHLNQIVQVHEVGGEPLDI